jgi:hypothetical protein
MFYPHLVDGAVENGYGRCLGGDMKVRSLSLILVTVAGLVTSLVAGCSPGPVESPQRLAETAPSAEVVDFDGVPGIAFGDTMADLTSRRLVATPKDACGPRVVGRDELSPVFAGERLVLLWAYPPFATPEGVGVGTSVAQARAAYPQAIALTAPPGSQRYDGLLVTHADRAYLFLHDGQNVTKTVAGFAEQARLLFDHGFGAC